MGPVVCLPEASLRASRTGSGFQWDLGAPIWFNIISIAKRRSLIVPKLHATAILDGPAIEAPFRTIGAINTTMMQKNLNAIAKNPRAIRVASQRKNWIALSCCAPCTVGMEIAAR